MSQNTIEKELFANPIPLGLLGLAIGSAGLLPACFGMSLTPAGFKTAAILALLFGGGCQFLAGMMSFANKNLFGGTLFTAFAFLWVFNWWSLDMLTQGVIPDATIGLVVEIVLFVIFAILAYANGFFSGVLFWFLADIDLLFLVRIFRSVTGMIAEFNIAIGIVTIIMILLSLWIAFGILINPLVGKQVFKFGAPLFKSSQK